MTALVRVQNLPWVGSADPATRYLAKLAEGSVPAQQSALIAAAKILGFSNPMAVPWHALPLTAADALSAKIRGGYAPRTTNRMLAAVRGVLDVCRAERWLVIPPDPSGYAISQREHYEALCERLVGAKVTGDTVGRVIRPDELRAFYASCMTDGIRGARDAAMLALGVGGGLRREDIAYLRVGHVDVTTGQVQVIEGKGGKNRITAVPDGALEMIRKWLEHRGGGPVAPMFIRIQGKHDPYLSDEPLSPRAVWAAIAHRCLQSKINPFKPHDMRRTFATTQLRDGTQIGAVQRALGHSSVTTTQRYNLLEIDQITTALRKVDPFKDYK